MHNYVDLKPKIAHVLLEALDMETYEPNLETLLGLVMVWQMETLAESSDFTKKSVKLILRKVRQSHWVPSVGMSALRVRATYCGDDAYWFGVLRNAHVLIVRTSLS